MVLLPRDGLLSSPLPSPLLSSPLLSSFALLPSPLLFSSLFPFPFLSPLLPSLSFLPFTLHFFLLSLSPTYSLFPCPSPSFLSLLPALHFSVSLCDSSPDHSWILQFYCKPQHYSPFLSRCLSFFPFLSVETAVPHWLSLTGHNSAGKKKKACPCTVT